MVTDLHIAMNTPGRPERLLTDNGAVFTGLPADWVGFRWNAKPPHCIGYPAEPLQALIRTAATPAPPATAATTLAKNGSSDLSGVRVSASRPGEGTKALQAYRIAAKQCLLTTRAAKWATVQVGTGRTVSEVAGELDCDWHTI
ncbi:MAG: hypothetical protein M3N95_01015, partial [Actinomycetota bacterium]|nr:hypothetical protein [Actinomycetota bacterium]